MAINKTNGGGGSGGGNQRRGGNYGENLAAASASQKKPLLEKWHKEQLYKRVEFRNFVRKVVLLLLIISFFTTVAFGVVNVLKVFLNFFTPFDTALGYTIFFGLLNIVGIVGLHIAYSFEKVHGCPDEFFTKEAREYFSKNIATHFEPGYLYDNRSALAKKEVKGMLFYLVADYILSVIIYWGTSDYDYYPDPSTPQGILYRLAQVALALIMAIRLYAILNSLHSYMEINPPPPKNLKPIVRSSDGSNGDDYE